MRCAVVVNDPALSASQPVPALAASAANALGHAAEAPCTVRANPVATLAALEAARAIAGAFRRRDREPDRAALALGALLAGYAIGSAGLGLHHVLAQTLVRVAGAAHGQANAVLLPYTLARARVALPGAGRGARGGRWARTPPPPRAGWPRSRAPSACASWGSRPTRSPRCADVAAERAELDATPPRADRAELLAIYESAC